MEKPIKIIMYENNSRNDGRIFYMHEKKTGKIQQKHINNNKNIAFCAFGLKEKRSKRRITKEEN